MAGIATHQDVQKHLAQYGQFIFAKYNSSGTLNSGAPSGVGQPTLLWDANSSEPGTLHGLAGEDTTGSTGHWYPQSSEQWLEFMTHLNFTQSGGPYFLAWLYKLGTTDCSTTGDHFTASFTQPLTRTIMGTSQNINFILAGYVTAAMTGVTTYKLATGAGGTGYVNQAGSNVVGATTTSLGSGAGTRTQWLAPLDSGDLAMQQLVAVNVTASGGGTGVITWFAIEPLANFGHSGDSSRGNLMDGAFGALGMADMKPATPTSGTLTAYLALVSFKFNGSGQQYMIQSGFPNV